MIFDKKERQEIFKISKEAVTPFWLGKNEYTKLLVDVQFDAPPPDLHWLKKQWDKFSSYNKWKAYPELQTQGRDLYNETFNNEDEGAAKRAAHKFKLFFEGLEFHS